MSRSTSLRLSASNPVVWLFLIQLCSMGAMEMSAPFWVLHLQTLGHFSTSTLAAMSAVVYAGPLVTAMLMTSFWGRLGDRVGHKPMLIRALLALTITQLWIALTEDVTSLLLARLIQGAFAGFIAAAQAYGTTLVGREQRSLLIARLQIATALGSLTGPLFGGMLFGSLNFQSVNLVAGLLCLGCTLAALWMLPTAKNSPPLKKKPSLAQTEQPVCESSSDPTPSAASAKVWSLWGGLLVGIVLIQAGKMMPQVFFGVYAVEVLHATAWQVGLSYGAIALGLVLSASWWARRFARRPEHSVLRQVEWVIWGCVVVTLLQGFSHAIGLFMLARVAWGVLLGALLPVFYSLLSRKAAQGQQGHALGLGNSAAKAGALLGLGLGTVSMMWLPISYLFLPVAGVYIVAALGIRGLRLHQYRSERDCTHVISAAATPPQ